MWFDARDKLDEIDGRSTATIATIATIATNRTIRTPSVAEVAIVAAPVFTRAGASFASGQNAVDFAPNPDKFSTGVAGGPTMRHRDRNRKVASFAAWRRFDCGQRNDQGRKFWLPSAEGTK